MQIAVYGKGGIGKSTVSANLSAALAARGQRVLQIGCDPKHDSTRLLHHGQKVMTILDYLLDTPADDQRLEDVLMEGYRGTGCVEAGGPRPGMGCAGRGILTAFDFLNRFHAAQGYDQIVYDVLGDVVCGGFAVPVRKQYADAVLLVTSGEAMSIYAANNILHGIRNLDPKGRRVAGILYNSRGDEDEYGKVASFAQAVGLPILARIPRSGAFLRAEKQAVTLVELDGTSAEAQVFLALAEAVVGGLTLYGAAPLDEEEMEVFIRGEGAAVPKKPVPKAPEPISVPEKPAEPSAPKKRALSDPFSRVPLFGCAYRGAVDLAVHIKDAAVLGHAPKSCTWYAMNGITSYARRGLYERGMLYPAFIPRQFENTDMTMEDAVFGGVEHARKKALSLVRRGVRTIIAVTACIPGMSGDDLEPVKKEIEALGCEMYIIHTDGIEAGDYNEGMALCYKILAREAIRSGVAQEPDCINLVYEHTISAQTDRTYTVFRDLLGKMGIRINCRFLCATSMEEIHGFLKAPYSVMARQDPLGQQLQELLEQQYGCRFVEGVLPRGFRETAAWVRQIGKLYGKESEAEQVIAEARAQYETRVEALRGAFAGKKVVIFLKNSSSEWIFELAEDLHWDVAEAILLGEARNRETNWNRRFSEKWENDRQALARAVAEYHPELVVMNDYGSASEVPPEVCTVNILRDVGNGFFAGTDCAKRWSVQMENTLEGGWKHDRVLFEKYCP